MTRTLKPLILNTGALALTLILIYTGISANDKLTADGSDTGDYCRAATACHR